LAIDDGSGGTGVLFTLLEALDGAPEPVLGQSVNSHRRSLLVTAKRTFLPWSHALRQFSLNDVDTAALGAIEPQVLKGVFRGFEWVIFTNLRALAAGMEDFEPEVLLVAP
jgi:hypothetical protein